MSYENLDTIADIYIPLLALFAFICIFSPWKSESRVLASKVDKSLRLFTVVACVYFLMFLDEYFGVFPSIGLDYSTHTALSLALTSFLVWVNKNLRLYLLVFFVAYLFLMLYQGYHTILDMLVTATGCGVLFFLLFGKTPIKNLKQK